MPTHNTALDYLNKSKIHISNGIAILTVPGILLVRKTHARCDISIFDVYNAQTARPKLEVIPFTFEKAAVDPIDEADTFRQRYNAKYASRVLVATPVILIDKSFIYTNTRFDIRYVSIGAYFDMGLKLMASQSSNSGNTILLEHLGIVK